jgi:error-prone DNA polymerase
MAAVRARRGLDDLDGWLPATGTAFLRTGAEMARRFARYPGAVARTVAIADELEFSLKKAKPNLPKLEVPEPYTSLMDWLRGEVWKGVRDRYRNFSRKEMDAIEARVSSELQVIEDKDFPGYFLIVHDIVNFAKRNRILCQGRGSAANSVVCYALGITAVDAHSYQLPFARFLSTTRNEEPDIDVDFDSDRREEVIQYVYNKYGRKNAAQVANVIQYRPKLAVRDMAKAFGYSTGQQDAWSKLMDSWGGAVVNQDGEVPERVVELAEELMKAPRHLGIHSGGMVLTERPVGEVCPIEHARKENRTVLQWDKDDCAWMGLVKFDLLGLGMLAALSYTIDDIERHLGERWDLGSIPKEEQGVYDQLCRADSVGVFQVESRAQMATLPRLKPRKFYELAVEVALIRPGPIQGGAVHPYIRRKTGLERPDPPHPSLNDVLQRTLGVPLFQEQLMQIAVEVGDCTADEADLLRRAMGSKRGLEKIGSLKDKLYAGMQSRGIVGEAADALYEKIEAFADFGFAESHAISFALLVYASAWFRLHYPAIFLAALLRAQPMGFYSPQSLVADSRRHGVEVRKPDLRHSGAFADLERLDDTVDISLPTGDPACLAPFPPPIEPYDPSAPVEDEKHRRDGNFAVRLGLSDVKSISAETAKQIVGEREQHGPYTDLNDLARRTGLTAAQLEALATAGAFDGFELSRRQALWMAGTAAQERPDQLHEEQSPEQTPMLPVMNPAEKVMADLWSTGISPDDYPTRYVRDFLDKCGAITAERLKTHESGRRVVVGGVVTHRQRPATAGSVTFLNLEDETGMINVICPQVVWDKYRKIARSSPALLIRGMLERSEGVTNVLAEKFAELPMTIRTMSRDFR